MDPVSDRVVLHVDTQRHYAVHQDGLWPVATCQDCGGAGRHRTWEAVARWQREHVCDPAAVAAQARRAAHTILATLPADPAHVTARRRADLLAATAPRQGAA